MASQPDQVRCIYDFRANKEYNNTMEIMEVVEICCLQSKQVVFPWENSISFLEIDFQDVFSLDDVPITSYYFKLYMWSSLEIYDQVHCMNMHTHVSSASSWLVRESLRAGIQRLQAWECLRRSDPQLFETVGLQVYNQNEP